MELREQRRLDAGASLVVRPKPIAKRLDHVVRGDAEVRVAILDHLEDGLQHADDGAVGAVHAFVEPAQAVEVTEELVGAVDKVNDPRKRLRLTRSISGPSEHRNSRL